MACGNVNHYGFLGSYRAGLIFLKILFLIMCICVGWYANIRIQVPMEAKRGHVSWTCRQLAALFERRETNAGPQEKQQVHLSIKPSL